MTLVLVYAKRTIRIVFKKVGVYSGTAFVHDYSRKKHIQKCLQTMRFTSLIANTDDRHTAQRLKCHTLRISIIISSGVCMRDE